MKKLITILFIFLGCALYAEYNPTFPAKTGGKDVLHLALQSIFKSTYGFAETQQEHFIGFMHYGFLDILDIGITANYHVIDIKTPLGKEKKHGVGDPSIYGRLYILNSKWIDLGLKCDLNVPLGNKNFGLETFTHNSIFISEFNLIYLRPYIIFGHYTTNETNGYFRFNCGVQKMIVPAWIPFIDVYTELNQKGHISKVPCWVVVGNIIKVKGHILKIEYVINTKDFKEEKGIFALRYMYSFKKN